MTRIKNPTSSVERLESRLDEAVMNKRVNEHMEESDKTHWTPQTKLRIKDTIPASPGSGSSSSGRTTSSTSWSNVSPKTRPASQWVDRPRMTHDEAERRQLVGDNELARRNQTTVGRAAVPRSEQDQGEYYFRRYRRESRSAQGTVTILQVKDYVYWPPERRKA